MADALGLSAVLTLVAYAITIARFAPPAATAARSDGRRHRAFYEVWNVIVFGLNVLALILIGLQLRGRIYTTQLYR